VMEKVKAASPSFQLCLDFSNTVEWRKSSKREDELEGLESVVKWSTRHGLVGGREATSLANMAKDERIAESSFRKALKLRETLYQIFSSVARGEGPDEESMRALNQFLSEAPANSKVVLKEGRFELGWDSAGGFEGWVLWPIAKSAADLLTSDQLGRLRECANVEDGCGWLFLDKTRNKTKRWCDMDTCGNRAKVRTWYDKHERATQKN
jgi:predicted RNA-binding Zn ribbon-like protein